MIAEMPKQEVWQTAERHYKVAFLAGADPYMVLYGGRHGIKSWSIARQLIIDAASGPLRTLCCRETMQSITDSVHELLSTQIEVLGLSAHFLIQKNEIIGINGSKFSYAGLRHNARLIKSFEGYDRAWVEEAQSVTKDSWNILLPTIRKEGSQIFISFNPDLVSDYTYQHWVCNPPPGTRKQETSYLDNIWLSQKSRDEIEYMQEADPDEYEHIYLGVPREAVEGAIYKDEIRQAEREGRICAVPYDARMPIDVSFDLGFADEVDMWFSQPVGMQIRVLDFYSNSHKAIDFYCQQIQQRGYTIGAIYLPWDGGTKQLGSGKSIEEIMRAKGFKVRVIPQNKVHVGINAVRTIFNQLWFDKDKCSDGLSRLRRYQWGAPDSNGQGRREPMHDDASHPADALRTLAMALRPEPIKQQPRPAPFVTPRYAPFG